ncbi:FAD-dependent oxidoreductase, partial [Corynebacterium diphtheriae]
MKIAVVGGGIVGLSTAFELSSRGHSVHVFDPNPA